MEDYIQQMTPNQKQAYTIAKRNLGSSFNLSLSIGFLEWKKSQLMQTSNPISNPNPGPSLNSSPSGQSLQVHDTSSSSPNS